LGYMNGCLELTKNMSVYIQYRHFQNVITDFFLIKS